MSYFNPGMRKFTWDQEKSLVCFCNHKTFFVTLMYLLNLYDCAQSSFKNTSINNIITENILAKFYKIYYRDY